MTKDKPGVYDVQVGKLFGRFRVWKPAKFTVSDLVISPQEGFIREEVLVSFTLTNIGETKGSYTATLKINGEPKATEEITLDGGKTSTVTFTTIQATPGTYRVEVNGLSGDFTQLSAFSQN